MFTRERSIPGYKLYMPLPQVAFQFLNQALACILLIVAFPVFLAVAAIVLVVEGRPLFYLSLRLGMHKQQYQMYKFRTLPLGTDKAFSSNFYTYTYHPLSFLTKFLRESRLDELPQLVNVFKGEMNFVGPRPVRPEIYESMCKDIVNYDFRFSVPPGMIGLAQLFTPHSAPKRIRSLIDNHLIKQQKKLTFDALLLLFTVVVVGKRIFSMSYGFMRNMYYSKVLGRFEDKRGLDRIGHENALCIAFSSWEHVCRGFFSNESSQEVIREKLLDINELYFSFQSEQNLSDEEYYFKLKIKTGKRKKTARVKGRLFRVTPQKHGSGYRYIFAYRACTDFNQYLVDQYFLKRSMYRL